MNHLGALIAVQGFDSSGEIAANSSFSLHSDKITTLGSSGLRLDQNYVLTVTLPFVPFLKSNSRGNDLRKGTKIFVGFSDGLTRSAELVLVDFNPCETIGMINTRNCIRGLVKNSSSELQLLDDQMGLCLLKVLDPNQSGDLPKLFFANPCIGAKVNIVGSPFGIGSPSVLANALLEGVISKCIFDEKKQISAAILDSRLYPLIEGSPIFKTNFQRTNFECLGIVVGRMTSKEIPDLGVVLSGSTVYSWIEYAFGKLSYSKLKSNMSFIHTMNLYSERISEFSKAVVSIEVGNTWATGTLISPSGDLITNSHVVQPFLKDVQNNKLKIFVRLSKENFSTNFPFPYLVREARLEFASDGSWDVCFLKIQLFQKEQLNYVDIFKPIHETSVSAGDSVHLIGYGLFCPSEAEFPVISSGVLSKSIRHPKSGNIIAYLSSTAVHRGSSGGIIVHGNSGCVIGLASCNLRLSIEDTEKHIQESKMFPHLNLSVPFSHIISCGLYLDKDKNVVLSRECKAKLNLKDQFVSNIYSLSDTFRPDEPIERSKL